MTEDDVALAVRLGQSLRQHRIARGWTQATLAETADISVNHLSYLERGERLPSVPMLVQLAGALQVTTSELLGETQTDAWTSRVLALSQSLSDEAKEVVMAMLQGVLQSREASRMPMDPRDENPVRRPTSGKTSR